MEFLNIFTSKKSHLKHDKEFFSNKGVNNLSISFRKDSTLLFCSGYKKSSIVNSRLKENFKHEAL